MSTYPQFKSSEVDWLGEIPSHWKTSSLKRVATIQTGLTLGKVYDGLLAERPYLRVANVQDGHLALEDLTTIEVPPVVAKRVELQPGDVLMTEGGDLDKLGRGVLWNAEIEGCLHQNHIFALRCFRHKLVPQFLTYLTSSQYGRDYFEATGKRTTNLASTSSTKVGAFPVPLPPLSEQQRIAAYLDASCAAIDAAVVAKRRQLETLDDLRHSNIYRAITKGLDDSAALKESGIDWLGEMPSHWAIRRIKDIAELRSGDSIQPEDITPAGDYPVYGGNGLRGFTSSFTHDGHFVLIGRQGALCGNINYANGKFWATEHAVVVTILRRYDTLWLGELLRVMNLNQYSNAAAQPGLAVDRIKFLRLPLPPPEEQIRVAQYVKGIILKTGRMTAHLESQIATLTAYRKSLIHECVTGQRRITEGDFSCVDARVTESRRR